MDIQNTISENWGTITEGTTSKAQQENSYEPARRCPQFIYDIRISLGDE